MSKKKRKTKMKKGKKIANFFLTLSFVDFLLCKWLSLFIPLKQRKKRKKKKKESSTNTEKGLFSVFQYFSLP
jgi:uncharacterized membrane protein